MGPVFELPNENGIVEGLVRGFVQGAPMAMWTQAGRFELCIMQVDEGFNCFTIHQDGCEDNPIVIHLSEVVEVLTGVQLMAVCKDNAIFDEHLDAWTGLAVVHGVLVGDRPTRRNLCVILVDSAQKQQILLQCLEAIRARCRGSRRDHMQDRLMAPHGQHRSDGGRNSMGSYQPRGDGGRSSMGPCGIQRPTQQEPSLRASPGNKAKSPFPVPVLSGLQSANSVSRRPQELSWQPPAGWQDDSGDESDSPPQGMLAAHVDDNRYQPQPAVHRPGPENAGPWKRQPQNCSQKDADFAAIHRQQLEVLRSQQKLKVDDNSDDEDDRLYAYRYGAKPDPSCSDRMCENQCILQ